jgi:hypothetical protein
MRVISVLARQWQTPRGLILIRQDQSRNLTKMALKMGNRESSRASKYTYMYVSSGDTS